MGGATARAPFVALLAAAFALVERLPDPLAEAEQLARASDARELVALASRAAPRLPVAHLIAAALASDEGDAAAARVALDRAARAAPWLGDVQHAIADALLVDAVERQEPQRLALAARAYAVAVATGKLAVTDAFAALAAADAPPDLFAAVAGRDRARREALVEHHALRLAEAEALAVARALDGERGGAGKPAEALAHRRLAAACNEAALHAEAARHFERAAVLQGTPDALAVERIAAWLAAGDAAAAAPLLLDGFANERIDLAQATALLQAARSTEAAADALYAALQGRLDRPLASRFAPLFAAIGQRGRQQQLLLRAGTLR